MLETYRLTEYEKSLIPFKAFTEIPYENELGELVVANTQPRDLELMSNHTIPENFEYFEYETIENFNNFIDLGFSIELNMVKFETFTSFTMAYVESGNTSAREKLQELSDFSENDSETVNFMGTEIRGVFVFSNPDSNGNIAFVCYSSIGRGIELIQFSDGQYLIRK